MTWSHTTESRYENNIGAAPKNGFCSVGNSSRYTCTLSYCATQNALWFAHMLPTHYIVTPMNSSHFKSCSLTACSTLVTCITQPIVWGLYSALCNTPTGHCSTKRAFTAADNKSRYSDSFVVIFFHWWRPWIGSKRLRKLIPISG